MTQLGYGPPAAIDGPSPIPQPFGLLRAAAAPMAGVKLVVEDNYRWLAGVQVYPYPPDTGEVFDACGEASPPATKGFGTSLDIPAFVPMTVVEPISCLSRQVPDQDAFRRRAEVTLEAIESYRVAREFMTGESIADNPYLADGDPDTVFPNLDAPTSIAYGIALLEETIASETGRLGLIHVSPLVLSMYGSGFNLDTDTGAVRTKNGTPVIADYGYAGGATPVGHADPGTGQQWIFATGPIEIRRSEIFVVPDTPAEALDRSSGGASSGFPNTFTYRAERYVLVTWDKALQAAVLVDPCDTTC